MSDLLADITDEELHERLARFGQKVTVKGKMTEAQRQIQKKKLNHLEVKERTDREKADRAAAKRPREDYETTSSTIGASPPPPPPPPSKRAKTGSRRRTVAVFVPEVIESDPRDGERERFEIEKPMTPIKSPLARHELSTPAKTVSGSGSSPLVIHLVDTCLGHAAAGVPVTLSVLHATKGWFQLAERLTSSEGECPGLITKDLFQSGFYRIRFDTEEYYKRNGMKISFPEVEVAVHVEEPGEKYTVSILLMPNGYTTTVIKNTRA